MMRNRSRLTKTALAATKDGVFKRTAVTIIWLWLGIFALVPNVLVIITSLLQQGDAELIRLQLTLNNYIGLFNPIYFKVLLRSILLASECTLISLILGYPFAYILARMPDHSRGFLLFLVIIPFWTSSLIRSYAIVAILKTHGLLNSALLGLRLIHQPLHLLYTHTAVLLGLVYTLLPFMVLPLYANIEKLDTRLLDAARDLGANKMRLFNKIILPLTLPGIIAGSMLVFLPAMSLFYIPDLLGGAKSLLVGNLIQNQFMEARNWPVGSAVSIVLTLLMGMMLLVYWRISKNSRENESFL